jgi:ParB family transcriptional regulator, chromosome partitioning protein
LRDVSFVESGPAAVRNFASAINRVRFVFKLLAWRQIMATAKKPVGRRLGRGLGSLINAPVIINPSDEAAPSPVATSGARVDIAPDGVSSIPVEQVLPNRRQPRQRFNDGAIASLAASIKQAGLMQPIVVRRAGAGFELVAGERRWRAFQELGKTHIPAIIHDLDDKTAAEWALIENLQREDLDVIERADGIWQLMEEFGISQTEVAGQLGIDRATVSNLLRLRDADVETREALQEGLISQGHAKALLSCRDLDRRRVLLAKCVREGWSVRETERQTQQVAVAGGSKSSGGLGTEASPHVADLEKRLAMHLGTKVAISLGRKKGQGKVTLGFYSLEQFDGLLEKMGFNPNQDL